MHTRLALLGILALAGCVPAAADHSREHGSTRGPDPGSGRGFTVDVLVGGRPLTQYPARGTRYVEAARGQEYAVRVCNPLGVRVGVALAIDGLNSIDARHSPATAARKWVLDPHECATIGGWQTDTAHARRFYFTSEDRSYAQWLGRTDDMGVIAAVFFRERDREPVPIVQGVERDRGGAAAEGKDAGASRRAERSAPAAGAAAPAPQQNAEDYAATGIGRETSHPVQQVYLDLEPQPAASITIRYEYRPQLVKLGILPPLDPDRLSRRERARGFDGEFCPVP